MGAGMFAVAVLFVRLGLALVIIFLRVFAALFLLPVWRPRGPRVSAEPRYYAPRSRQLARYHHASTPGPSLLYELGRLVQTWRETSPAARQVQATVQQKAVDENRNERDCIRALTDLGMSKTFATQMSSQAVAELGPNADLNALVKRALQLSARPT